jgi:hypothetical protein
VYKLTITLNVVFYFWTLLQLYNKESPMKDADPRSLQKISKDTWAVKIAYAFTSEEDMPTTFDKCTLWQRFGVMLVPWVLFNIFVWLIAFVVLGIIAQVIWRIILFVFVGQKLVYNTYDTGQSSSVVGFSIIKRVVVLRYERENIWWMNWSQFERDFRCPILMIIFGLGALGLAILFVTSTPAMFHAVVGAATAAGSAAYSTIGWWGSALVALIALGILSYLSRKGYRAFAATPSGTLFVSYIAEWKEQHCTRYELV